MASSYYNAEPGAEIFGDYVANRSLGTGRFSSVWLCSRGNQKPNMRPKSQKPTGGHQTTQPQTKDVEQFALKIYRHNHEKYWSNELDILQKLQQSDSPNIVKMVDHFATIKDNKIYPVITMGYAGKPLSSVISSGVSINFCRHVAKQIFAGIESFHNLGIIHTDIKPDNIMITGLQWNGGAMIEPSFGQLNVRIGDFGSATACHHLRSLYVGTPDYCAPEIQLLMRYTKSIDIWAACVVVCEMIVMAPPFDEFDEYHVNYGNDIYSGSFEAESASDDVPDGVSDGASDCIPNSSVQGSADIDSHSSPSSSQKKCDGSDVSLESGSEDSCVDCSPSFWQRLEIVVGRVPDIMRVPPSYIDGMLYVNGNVSDPIYVGLSSFILLNCGRIDAADVPVVANFLGRGLRYSDRATATELLHDEWFSTK